jgi:hypothetical protein
MYTNCLYKYTQSMWHLFPMIMNIHTPLSTKSRVSSSIAPSCSMGISPGSISFFGRSIVRIYDHDR